MASTTAEPPAGPRRRAAQDGRARALVEPYRLTPKLARASRCSAALVLVVFAALFAAALGAAGARPARSTSPRRRRTSCAPCACRRRAGTIVDRNGDVLVTNRRSPPVELWPAGLPKVYATGSSELRQLARVTRVPLYEIAAKIIGRRAADDLLDPVVVRDAGAGPLVTYLEERADNSRASILARLRPPLPAQLARSAAPRLRRRDLAAELRRSQERLPAGDEIGQAGVESSFDTYLRGVAGAARVRVDSLGRPRSAAAADDRRRSRAHRPADDRHSAAARRGERAPRTGSSSRQQQASGRRTAARSSR